MDNEKFLDLLHVVEGDGEESQNVEGTQKNNNRFKRNKQSTLGSFFIKKPRTNNSQTTTVFKSTNAISALSKSKNLSLPVQEKATTVTVRKPSREELQPFISDEVFISLLLSYHIL